MTRDEAITNVINALREFNVAARKSEDHWLQLRQLREATEDARCRYEEAKQKLFDVLLAEAELP